jgi:hypothetical protein
MSDDLEPRVGADAEHASSAPERVPGRLLEERTVRELRARGLLRQPQPHRAWWAAAAAAAVAFFATGYAVGQRSASLAIVETAVESQQRVAMETALQVQRAGSAWIASLSALAELSVDADSEALQQGREAARSALYAAALELAGLTPGDPVAARLLWVLSDPAETGASAPQAQATIWF